jgi:hypothetical protein
MTEQQIRELIYDYNALVECIKNFPQTYKTILGKKFFSNSTFQFVLRTKLNKLIKEGLVCKATIPGTRFGQIIYYAPGKCYNIVIESSRTGKNAIYCFSSCQKNGRYYLRLKKYWLLDEYEWKESNGKEYVVFLGNCLQMI